MNIGTEIKKVELASHETISAILAALGEVPADAVDAALPETQKALAAQRERVKDIPGMSDSSIIKALPGLFLIFLMVGCATPTESDRQLNRQNIQIGEEIEATAPTPALKQAGSDVKENSLVLEKVLLGVPKEPVKPYSPEVSKALRDQSTQDHSTPWWKLALGGLVTLLAGAASKGILANMFPAIFGGPIGTALTNVIEGIARTREKLATPGAPAISHDDFLEIIEGAQKDPKAKALIQGMAHKVEAKLALKQ